MLNIGIKIALICLISLISCRSGNNDLLEKKTMASILADLQWTEAKVSRMSFINPDSATVAFKVLEKEIYKKYKTDSATFAKNYDEYSKRKEDMLDIYVSAERILEKRKIRKNK